MAMISALARTVPVSLALLGGWAAITSAAEIYQWRDAQGQVHFGDRAASPPHAQAVEQAPGNTPLPAAAVPPEALPPPAPPPRPALTAPQWAQQHCQTRLRILYTDHWIVPCLPTSEVPVYLCDREPPARLQRYFGRRFRYENRSAECGPEVFAGEILYLKGGD